MLPNIFKLNPIQIFHPEGVSSPMLLSVFDKIMKRLGFGRKKLKPEAIPIENTELQEDEWSAIQTEKRMGCPHLSDDNRSDDHQHSHRH